MDGNDNKGLQCLLFFFFDVIIPIAFITIKDVIMAIAIIAVLVIMAEIVMMYVLCVLAETAATFIVYDYIFLLHGYIFFAIRFMMAQNTLHTERSLEAPSKHP